MTLLIVVLAIYFIGMIVLGWVGKKYADTYDNYISAARNAGTLMIIGSAVGSHIGNGFVVGGAGGGAADGISGIWYGIGCALSYLTISVVLNKYVYRKGYISVSEFLKERYNDTLSSTVYSLATAISYVGNIGAQIMAGKALFMAFGLNGNMGAVIITLVVLAYSELSGLWGAYATSVVQVGIITFGMVATSLVLISQGGIGVISDALASGVIPQSFTDFAPTGWEPIIMMIIPISLAALTDQCTVQRINSAKSEGTALRGMILSTVIMIPLAFMPTFIGMYGVSVYGIQDNSVFFTVAMDALGPLLAAIVIAAVCAAVMSTIDSMLIAFSTITLHGIYKGYINPKVEDKTLKRANIFVNIIIAGISLMIALSFDSIIGVLTSTYVFVSATCFVPFVGSIYWKRGTAKGAISSAIVGIIFVILNFTGLFTPPYADIFPILPALIVYVVVSLIDKGNPSPETPAEA